MIFAVLFALGLLAWLLPSLWLRLPRLTLLDCFLLAVAMYFGAYTVIDAMTVDTPAVDEVTAATVFVMLVYSTMILWWFARRPSRLVQETALVRLRADWQACSPWPVLALIAFAVSYRVVTMFVLQDFSTVEEADAAQAEGELPYWFTTMAMVASLGMYPAALCAWGKFRAARGGDRLFWLAMTAVSALMILGMGRRAIFAFLVIVGWDLLEQGRQQRRRWVQIGIIVLALPLMLTISNAFQTYRMAMARGVPMESVMAELEDRSLLENASDVNRTIENLEQRTAMWRFNYELVDAHLSGNGQLQWGRLITSSLQNYIPAAIYHEKVVFSAENEMLRAFGLLEYDRPESVFSSTYADFGAGSVIIAPLIILLIVWCCGWAFRRFRDPFLRALLMGVAIYYAMNMEQSYAAPIGFARDFIVIAIAYVCIRNTILTARSLVRYAVHS